MSEQDESRPLTRRERRLREAAESSAASPRPVEETRPEEEPPRTPEEPAQTASPAPEISVDEIDVPLYDENGQPRSRRELRILREQLLAERLAAQREAESSAAEVGAGEPEPETSESDVSVPDTSAPDSPTADTAVSDASPEPESTSEPESVPEPASDSEPVAASGPEAAPETEPETAPVQDAPVQDTAAEPSFDDVLAPTQPFSVSDLREAEENGAEEDGTEQDAAADEAATAGGQLFEDVPAPVSAARRGADGPGLVPETDIAPDSESADGDGSSEARQADSEPPQEPKASKLPWRRRRAAAAEAEQAEVAPEEEAAEETATPPAAEPESPSSEQDSTDSAVADESSSAAPAEPAAAENGAEEPTEQEKPAKQKFSFPDIVPPEESTSVIDDPASRVVPESAQGDRVGFDDLINRAVVQEGSTSSGTAALILPTLPEDTGGLTGPLGGTGELFLTGSINLPKSLSETGGHSALHETVEAHRVEESDFAPQPASASHSTAPVAARRAVSAVTTSGTSMLTETKKERSKLPIVLSVTGGCLLVGVVGFFIWGGTTGLFG